MHDSTRRQKSKSVFTLAKNEVGEARSHDRKRIRGRHRVLLNQSVAASISNGFDDSASQHTNSILIVISSELACAKPAANSLVKDSERALKHLYWLADSLEDAFMAATCRSLIQGFEEVVISHDLNYLLTQYKLPLRYFIQKYGNRELARQLDR